MWRSAMVLPRGKHPDSMEAIMFKDTDQTIRALVDAELDVVTGGSIDSWLAGQPKINVPQLDLGWTFKDQWAKWTIGR
jgi:hypothetical protein